MSMVLRYPGYLPETASNMNFGDWYFLRTIGRWPRADELDDSDRTLYWYSVPVRAIIFKTTLQDASTFSYRNHAEAARELSAFFERTIDPSLPTIRIAPRLGRGIAFHVTDAVSVWAPRPPDVLIPFGWAYSGNTAVKRWTDVANTSIHPFTPPAPRAMRRDWEDMRLPLDDVVAHRPRSGSARTTKKPPSRLQEGPERPRSRR